MRKKDQQSALISRRSLDRMLVAIATGALNLRRLRAAGAPLFEVDHFGEGLPGQSARKTSLTYRADAVIVLLSVPVYRRQGVGSGFASLAEAAHAGERYYSLRFAGASRPERAAGLDRVGAIREVALERGAILSEAAYFGVLTSSPEETLEEGRRSLAKSANKCNEYTAIEGKSQCGLTRSAVTHFQLPAAAGQNLRVIAEARANFQSNRPPWRENQWSGDHKAQVPPTFLYALMRAIRRSERTSEEWYVYSERSYRLRLDKEPDHQQGKRFAELGLASRPDRVLEVRGRTREERSGRQTTFRLWIENGPESSLPLRIEFQPRSYLRLSFEVDPQAATTPLEEEL